MEEELPLADQLQLRKQLSVFSQELKGVATSLARQQAGLMEAKEGLEETISQSDLRRAIALAFTEFETRMQEQLQESHGHVLSKCCRREEIEDFNATLANKVNWHDYQFALGKISELRSYIDHTAESVFLGHRDALDREFSRKADACSVDLALKNKADFREINDLRARLERLETLHSYADVQQAAKIDKLRDELSNSVEHVSKTCQQQLESHTSGIAALQEADKQGARRVEEATAAAATLSARLDTFAAAVPRTNAILGEMKAAASVNAERIAVLFDIVDGASDERAEIREKVHSFETKWAKRFAELDQSWANVDKQLDFLTSASEAVKRRLREISRAGAEQHNALALEKDVLEARLAKHIQTLETMEIDDKFSGLEARLDALPDLDVRSSSRTPEAQLPIGDMLRQMLDDCTTGLLETPSASGTPRLLAPLPTPRNTSTVIADKLVLPKKPADGRSTPGPRWARSVRSSRKPP